MAHPFPTLMKCVLPRPRVAKEEIRSQFHRPLHSHISKQAPESSVSAFQNNQTRQHRMTNFVVSPPFNASPNSLASLLVNKEAPKISLWSPPTHVTSPLQGCSTSFPSPLPTPAFILGWDAAETSDSEIWTDKRHCIDQLASDRFFEFWFWESLH